MGTYLSEPIKEKHPEQGSNKMCAWGLCSMQGWRQSMEDEHIAEKVQLKNKQYSMLFAVFDGHGGDEAAKYAKQNFIRIFKQTKSFQNSQYDKALKETFLKIDVEMKLEDEEIQSGATSCVVLITEKQIICANAGDSRAVLCQSGQKAIGLSEDHKPQNPEEMRRIMAAGRMVSDNRVDGNLALSRALGDFQFKDAEHLSPENQAVTAVPDITVRERTKDDMFIMVACDGIWDCLTNQQLVDKINKKLSDSKSQKPQYQNYFWPVDEMFDEIIAPNTEGEDGCGTDNMTAILVKLFNDDLDPLTG